MDPVSTLHTCISLTEQIYDLKSNIDSDSTACDVFFNRVLSLTSELVKIQKSARRGSLDSMTTALDQMNAALANAKRILSSRLNQRIILFGFVLFSFSDSFVVDLIELNVQLDRCMLALQMCVADADAKALDAEELPANNEFNIIKFVAKNERILSTRPTVDRTRMIRFEDLREFQVMCVLSEGIFANTSTIKHSKSNETYVIREISIRKVQLGGVDVSDVERDLATLQNLNHPHMVKYHYSYVNLDNTYINVLMDFVDGESLDEKINDPSVQLVDIAKWWREIASALCYLHYEMNVVHRDIKPKILKLSSTGRIVLVGIDIECICKASLGLAQGVNTTMYFSFEKFNGQNYDGRDDVWAVGCVIAELMTRKRLSERGGAIYMFHNTTINDRRLQLIDDCEGVNPRFGSIIRRMLEPEQTKRCDSRELMMLLTARRSNLSAAMVSCSVDKGIWAVLRTMQCHSTDVKSVHISPDCRFIASGSFDKTVKLYDNSGNILKTFSGYTYEVWSVCFNSDSTILAVGLFYGEIILTNVESGQDMRNFQCDGTVNSMSFNSNGSKLVAGTKNNMVVFDVSTGQQLLITNGKWYISVSFSSDDSLIVAGCGSNSIEVWSVSPYQLIRTIQNDNLKQWVNSVCVSFDGSKIIAGKYSKVTVWDTATGSLLMTLSSHISDVRSICMSRDGSMIVSGSNDNTIKVWNAATGDLIQTLKGHTDRVNSVCLGCNDTLIVSGSSDKSVKFWGCIAHDDYLPSTIHCVDCDDDCDDL